MTNNVTPTALLPTFSSHEDLAFHYSQVQAAHERIKDKIHATPLLTSRTLNELTGAKQVYVKAENMQRGGAFKARGAFNAILQLTEEQRKRGVTTHSSGNHAQALALASGTLGVHASIVMPNNAPVVKSNATRGYGAEVIFCEPTLASREGTVQQLIDQHGYELVHPYDNINIIHGAGTAALEILREKGHELDLVMCPVGGGGLLSGTAIVTKGYCAVEKGQPGSVIKVYGAEPLMASDAYQSLKSGVHHGPMPPKTIADGLRTSIGKINFEVIVRNSNPELRSACQSQVAPYVDDIITVSEDEIVEAMRFLWERMKIVVEPSGAVPLAALLRLSREHPEEVKGKTIAIIISGGNIELDEFFKQFKEE